MMMTAGELKTLKTHPMELQRRSFVGKHPRITPVFTRKDLDFAKLRFECYGEKRKYLGKKLSFDEALIFVNNHKGKN